MGVCVWCVCVVCVCVWCVCVFVCVGCGVCVCVCVCVGVVVAGFYENVKKNKGCQEIPVFILSFLSPVAIFIPVL